MRFGKQTPDLNLTVIAVYLFKFNYIWTIESDTAIIFSILIYWQMSASLQLGSIKVS